MEFTAVALPLNVTLECHCDVQSCGENSRKKNYKAKGNFSQGYYFHILMVTCIILFLTLMVKAFHDYVICIIQNILKFQ